MQSDISQEIVHAHGYYSFELQNGDFVCSIGFPTAEDAQEWLDCMLDAAGIVQSGAASSGCEQSYSQGLSSFVCLSTRRKRGWPARVDCEFAARADSGTPSTPRVGC